MEDEEDDSGDDAQEDGESYHEEDEGDEEEREERFVRFDIPWEQSNGAVSHDDTPSESEDASETSEKGEGEDVTITSNQNTSSKQPPEDVGPTENVSSTLKKKREEDLEKGQAVKRQIV